MIDYKIKHHKYAEGESLSIDLRNNHLYEGIVRDSNALNVNFKEISPGLNVKRVCVQMKIIGNDLNIVGF